MQTSTGIFAAAAPQQRFSDCALFHDDDNWADQEIAGCVFKDARLGCRFGKLLKRIGSAMGESIPLVCQDWANTKAAYRFFANGRVSEGDILGSHFHATRDRFAATCGQVLVIHDTTEFTYERDQPARPIEG